MNAVLQQVKDFAAQAHNGQQRKYSSEPYIVHPVRVMEMCRLYKPELPVLAAALLHDVLEDTDVDQKELEQFLHTVMEKEEASRTMELVVELTDVYVKQRYPKWNRRKRKQKEADRIEQTSPDSQTVKYADIIDSCKEIVEHDPEFADRFLRECRALLKRMPRGVPELYRQANDTVITCLKKLDDIK
jgi:guanosine-3',5'-bis(diphosphate) 3'-pyrophosphohydrolase